jgi:hypothetical protein
MRVVTLEEFVERLCRIGSDRQPRRFPRQARDRSILFRSILQLIPGDRVYSEAEINERLQVWNRDVAPAITTDHVTLRRLLVDHGHLERTADGTSYRVSSPPQPLIFDLDVYDVDVRATTSAYRARPRRARPRPRADQ